MTPTVDVELVYLYDCPHWREADARVRDAMHTAGLDPAPVRYRGVRAEDAPAQFPGSPTVLIEGRDPFPTPTAVGPTCRRYQTERGVDGAPSLAQLVDAFTHLDRWPSRGEAEDG